MGVFYFLNHWGMCMKTVVTERLVLRPLKLSDLEAFYHYCKKPNIGPSAGWKPHESIEESLRILRMMISEHEVWGITLKHDDTLIGTIGLHARDFDMAIDNAKEIGYVLDDTYWGKGYMVEAVLKVLNYAFLDLELDKVTCGHHIENIKSKRVIEKTNLFYYTHEEERKHYDGTMISIMMYQILRHEYMEKII
ncbi:MAG: N-acetyltransferase [Tenericutes bacterium HGW-Tenericutes-6]|nr:MAG: N-acetyltransferase [Tenericutes bacterium HGW-Tenericutes-6]